MKYKKKVGIHFYEEGEGADVLLLHSAGQVPLGLEERTAKIGKYAHVVTPNIYDMTKKVKRLDYASVADILDNFIESNNLHKPILIGCSFGGALALSYAAHYKNKVKKIIACDPIGWPLNRSFFDWLKQFIIMHQITNRLPAYMKRRNPGILYATREAIANPIGVFRGLQLAIRAEVKQELPLVDTPVHLMWGSDDNYVTTSIGRSMADMLPNATFEIMPNPSHFWYNLEPELLIDYVIKTLEDPSSSPKR